MKNFAITGVAGYIAPRHLQAIKETGNNLIAALDINDSVGILDKYSPNSSFFIEFERFQRHLDKLRRAKSEDRADFISICTPNFLHDSHIRLAFTIEADAICEKPLVLNPWNLDALEVLEQEFQKKVYTILQLRVHEQLVALKEKLHLNSNASKKEVVLTYITSRGKWYDYSWKGNPQKSGGIATNIGVHFFDLLIWLFGNVVSSELHISESRRMSGFLELENAYVSWYLSIESDDLPYEVKRNGKTSYRCITINGEEMQFSEGFTDLHTRVYERTLSGNGFGIQDARPSIELVYNLRNGRPTQKPNSKHPYLVNLENHF